LQYFIENAALGYRSLFCSIEVERPNRPACPQLGEGCELATPAGFEPATTRLEGECSIQLSYGVIGLISYGPDHSESYPRSFLAFPS
jgi:hypothetical protein